MSRSILGLAVLAILVLLTAGPQTVAQDDQPGFMAARGRASFRLYCASCHGQEGYGNGSVAKFLTVEPANLTLLAQKYGGELPEDRLRSVIDGREEVGAHGRREMPIWGDVFQDPIVDRGVDTGETPEERAARKISELIMFLRTIQVEEP